MGDLEKWVPMSEMRVSNIINYIDFLLIELDGIPDETLSFFFRIFSTLGSSILRSILGSVKKNKKVIEEGRMKILQ